jgi:hypothetical protein
MKRASETADSQLDHFMPQWHFGEYHSLRIDAPTDVVMTAAREVTWQETPTSRFFLKFTKNEIRGERRIFDDFAADGQQVLAITDNEMVYGGIGSDEGPAKLDQPIAEVFRDFHDPTQRKSGFNLRHVDGTLSTETRILAMDEEMRKSFGRYWVVIRVPSGIIRMALLRAVKRRVDTMLKSA